MNNQDLKSLEVHAGRAVKLTGDVAAGRRDNHRLEDRYSYLEIVDRPLHDVDRAGACSARPGPAFLPLRQPPAVLFWFLFPLLLERSAFPTLLCWPSRRRFRPGSSPVPELWV